MAILFSSLKSCLKAKRDLPFNEEGFLIINTHTALGSSLAADEV